MLILDLPVVISLFLELGQGDSVNRVNNTAMASFAGRRSSRDMISEGRSGHMLG